MSWFKHRHWWRRKTGKIEIYAPGSDLAEGFAILEDCSCGAVRTIEFFQGHAPVVRLASAPPEEKAASGIEKPLAERE